MDFPFPKNNLDLRVLHENIRKRVNNLDLYSETLYIFSTYHLFREYLKIHLKKMIKNLKFAL